MAATFSPLGRLQLARILCQHQYPLTNRQHSRRQHPNLFHRWSFDNVEKPAEFSATRHGSPCRRKSYANLRERGHVSTWLVVWNNDSSLVDDSDDDDDDDLVEFNFDDFDFDDDSAQESPGIEADYIKRHIARIPQYGDDSRWRLADYLDMFDNLSRDGSLTNEQRQAVDNFVVGYQSVSSEFVEGDTDA